MCVVYHRYSMTEPPIQQHGDTVTIRGAALPLMYRAVLALAARHNRDGITPPPLLREFAPRAVPRHHDVATAPSVGRNAADPTMLRRP